MPADIESMGAEGLSELFAPIKLAEARYSRRTASASYSDSEALYLKPAALASLAAPRDRDLSEGEFWSLFNEMTFELSCAESSAAGQVREASVPLTMFEAWTFLDAQRYQPALPEMPEAFEPGGIWRLASAPATEIPAAAMPYASLLAGYRPGADRNLGMGLLALWQRQSGLSGPQVARAVTRFVGLSAPAPVREPADRAPEPRPAPEKAPEPARAVDRLPNPPDQDDLDVELSWTTGERDLRPLPNGMFELAEPSPGGGEKTRRLTPEAAVRMIREEGFAPDFEPGELTRAQARYAAAVDALDLAAAEARAASERAALRLQTAERYASQAAERAGKAEDADLAAALSRVASGLRDGSIGPDSAAAARIGRKGEIPGGELAELAREALASAGPGASPGEGAGDAPAEPSGARKEAEPERRPEAEARPATAGEPPEEQTREEEDLPDRDLAAAEAYEGTDEAHGEYGEDHHEEMDSIAAAIDDGLGGYAPAALGDAHAAEAAPAGIEPRPERAPRAYSAQVDAGGGAPRASAAEAAARSVEELAASIAGGAAPGPGKKAATERQLEIIAGGLRSGAIAPEAAGLAEMMAAGGERDAASELIHDHAAALGIKTREEKSAQTAPRRGRGERAAASPDPAAKAAAAALDAWSELAKGARKTDGGEDLATSAMLRRAARAVEDGAVGADDPLLAAVLESRGQWDATRRLLDERRADIGVDEYGPRRGQEREAWKAAGKARAAARAARPDERLGSHDAPDAPPAAAPDAAADCVTLTLPPTLGIDAKGGPIPPASIGDDRKTGARRAKVTIPPGTVAPGGRDISGALLYVDVSAIAEMPDGSLEVDLSASKPVTLYLAGGGKAKMPASDLAQAAARSRRAVPQEAGRERGRRRAEARAAAASRDPHGSAPQAKGGETRAPGDAAAASAPGSDAEALRALLEEVSEKYSALESSYARMASELERVSARLAALEGARGGKAARPPKFNAIGRGKPWKPDSVVLSGKGPSPQAAKAATPSSDKRRGASRPHSGDSPRGKNRKA